MATTKRSATKPASERISKRISELDGWRGEMLGRIRAAVALNIAGKKRVKKPRGRPGVHHA